MRSIRQGMRTVLCLFLFGGSLSAQAGQAVHFVPVSSTWLTVPHSASLAPANAITVAAWAYHTPNTMNSNYQATIIRKNPAPGAEMFILRRRFGDYEWIVKTVNNGSVLVNGGAFPINQWVHIAGVYDGMSSRLYVNGVLVNQVPCSGTLVDVAAELRIGDGEGNSVEHWTGDIDQVRIWNVARSATQIQSDRFLPSISPAGLMAEWNFNGNYADSAGANPAIASGAPAVGFITSTAPIGNAFSYPDRVVIGATANFDISGPQPNSNYLFEMSVTGTAPGISLPDGRLFRLNPPLLYQSFGSSYPSAFLNFSSALDATGHSAVSFSIPDDNGLVGFTVSSAYVLLDVSAPSGISYVSPTVQTTIVPPPPQITSITPNLSVPSGGGIATITGSNFFSGCTVRFGTTPATNVNIVSPNQITLTIPAHSIGTVPVILANFDGQSTILTGAFAYQGTPTVSSVNPTSGPAGGSVVITGAAFAPGLSLTIGGVPIIPTSVTNSQISFVNPGNLPCASAITVTNPIGLASTAAITFNPIPTISQLLPSSVGVAGGSIVFVNGTGFSVGSVVSVNGQSIATTFISATTLRLTAPPSSAGPASVVVTTPAGCTASATLTYF